MKNFLLLALFLLSNFYSFAQEDIVIDEVRVHFDDNKVKSKQMGMDLSPSGKLLAFAFEDGTIKVFETRSNRFITSKHFDYKDLFEIRFTKNEERIAIVSGDNWQVVNWKSGEVLHQQTLPNKPSRVAMGKKHDWVAIGTFEVTTYVYDLTSFQETFKTTLEKGHHIGGLDFSYDDKYLAMYGKPTANFPGPLKVYEMGTNKLVGGEDKSPTKLGINFSNEEDYTLRGYAYMFGAVHSFNFKTGNSEIVRLLGKGKKIKNLIMPSNIYSYDGNYVVTGLYQGIGLYSQRGDVKFTTRRSNDTKSKAGGRAFSWQMGIDVNNIKQIPNTSKFIINAYGDNINQIFDADEMKIIGYFYVDANDEFAVIARDGRVDGVTETFEKLAWTERKSNKVLPMDVNLEQFITPKLYNILTSNESKIADNTYLKEAIANAPELTILSPDSISTSEKNTINITYSTVDNGDPVASVQVLVNGKSLSAKTRGFKRIDDKSVTVSLIPGQNIIKMYAISEKGYQSVADQIIVNYKGLEAKSELFMLTIGLNEYRNPRYNLNYASADATAFQSKVKSGASSIFTSVKEYFIENQNATKDNILAAFDEISAQIGPEDVFVFYYAGHGVMSEEDNPLFYIVPYDITQLYGNNTMLIEKGLSAKQLKSLSESIPAQKQLFVLDACQSGGMTEMLAMRGAAEEKAIAQLARSTGTYWITASNSEQFATEFAELGHGLFTYTILEGLSGKADGGEKDHKITVKELSAYLNDRVPMLSEQHKGQPQFPTSYGFGQDFPVVIVNK